MNKNDMYNWKFFLNRMSYIVLCVILTYAVFWGVGNPVSIGGISLWTALILAFGAAACFPVALNLKEVFRSPNMILLLLFGLWVLWSAVRGWRAGNDINIIKRDISGLVYFALFPFIFTVLNKEKRFHTIMKYMMNAAFALAILMYGIWMMYLENPPVFDVIREYCERISFLNYTKVSDTIPRLLFVSIPFQLVGCAFPVYFQLREQKFRFYYCVITGVCLSTLLMTLTRALYLSAVVSAFFLILLCGVFMNHHERKVFWKQIGGSLACFFVVILLVSVAGKTNYLEYALLRVTTSFGQGTSESASESTEETNETQGHSEATEASEPASESTEETNETQDYSEAPESTESITESTEEPDGAEHYLEATVYSDSVRYWIKHELMQSIRTSPIIGNGMGLQWVLKKEWPEYSYLDLWAKTGIIGVFLYLLPIMGLMLRICINYRKGKYSLLSVTWVCVMLGLMCYSVFQPYLNNIQCIILYCCTLCTGHIEQGTSS